MALNQIHTQNKHLLRINLFALLCFLAYRFFD
nr:MAG TPA: hypothetical protein [Caudoviricetes sp.]